jgi:NADPH:quinone reductase-like Zn-dependent oxidoreductase
VSLFKKLRVVKGKSIVITGGSGGVGGFAVQLAKLSGLTVYATCSSKNADYVRQLGADDVIDYTANVRQSHTFTERELHDDIVYMFLVL